MTLWFLTVLLKYIPLEYNNFTQSFEKSAGSTLWVLVPSSRWKSRWFFSKRPFKWLLSSGTVLSSPVPDLNLSSTTTNIMQSCASIFTSPLWLSFFLLYFYEYLLTPARRIGNQFISDWIKQPILNFWKNTEVKFYGIMHDTQYRAD